MLNKPQCDMPSDFITSPADVVGPIRLAYRTLR